ncbi:helix-turn-helix domain-containing protein [Aerobium aerolatum]|uniref:Helix-turn-helix n=1 Tax=Aquamicrobium aerolatum DSM 21857 TaxID=1121003 RepID=A0A1I3SWP0_9HYPH|nr:helix-turn-helix transcriptional regulator [Aquamicrobium aerolatum]SFJ63175.1 Helix-turn-helix [Aquamicrobium aerolatum DSM 21857]
MAKGRLSADMRDVERPSHRAEAGRWLRQKREAAGLTQRELAEKVGVLYYTYISQVELGQGKIIPERWPAWAEALDVHPRIFSMKMLQSYEPFAYKMIFGDDELQ